MQRTSSIIASLDNSHLGELAEIAVLLWLKSQFKLVSSLSNPDSGYDFIVENPDDPTLVTYVVVKITRQQNSLSTIRHHQKLTVKQYLHEVRNLMFVFIYLDEATARIAKDSSSDISFPKNSFAVIGYLGEGNSFQAV